MTNEVIGAIVGAIASVALIALLPHLSGRAARARARMRGRMGRGRSWLPIVLGVAVGVAIGALMGGALGGEDAPDPRGRILSPAGSRPVETGTLSVAGTLAGIPDDRHVWIAVQRGNALFPKEPEIPSQDERFAQAINEAGPPHRFSLVLLTVDGDGQRAIERWFEEGMRTGSFPPFTTIPGSRRLDVVDVVQRSERARVPDVTGQPADAAREALEGAGLEVEVSRRFSGRPKDEVIDQDPPAGEEVDPGTAVELTVSKGAKPRRPAGEIVSPGDGQRIEPGALAVEGTLSAIPDERHVWIAVEVGGGLFPKEPEVAAEDGRFTAEVVEGGAPHRFSLVLLMVDGDGQRAIERWVERGIRTGSSPAFTTIPGSRQLDVVRNVIQTP